MYFYLVISSIKESWGPDTFNILYFGEKENAINFLKNYIINGISKYQTCFQIFEMKQNTKFDNISDACIYEYWDEPEFINGFYYFPDYSN